MDVVLDAEADADAAARTVAFVVPRWAEHLAALLLAVAALLLGLLLPLTLLEALPETVPRALAPLVFSVGVGATLAGLLGLLALSFGASRVALAWRDRARLAAATTAGTVASLALPEVAGLGVLAVAWAALAAFLRGISVRVVSAAAALVAGAALLAFT